MWFPWESNSGVSALTLKGSRATHYGTYGTFKHLKKKKDENVKKI